MAMTAAEVDDDTISTRLAVHQSGATFRQLDYWARTGLLRPIGEGGGSGSWRRWHPYEVEVAAMIVRLLDAGLVLAVAGPLARTIMEALEGVGDEYTINIGDGITLTVDYA